MCGCAPTSPHQNTYFMLSITFYRVYRMYPHHSLGVGVGIGAGGGGGVGLGMGVGVGGWMLV